MARIAFIVDEMFEDSEFRVPYDRLRKEGHEVVIIGRAAGDEIRGKKGKETIKPERSISEVSPDDFDALVIPGGYSPDKLRMDARMVALTRDIYKAGKPLAAVCHAPWMLVEADIARGRTVTSWPSIKTDLVNAGARWVDRELVEDGNLITSRKPDDLPVFSEAIVRQLKGRGAERGKTTPATETATQPAVRR